MNDNINQPDEHSSLVARLLNHAEDLREPMHSAAVYYMTTRSVQFDLLRRFQPQQKRGGGFRSNRYWEQECSGWDEQVLSQMHHPINPHNGTETIATVDLLLTLSYKMKRREFDSKTKNEVTSEIELCPVPLLVEVRPDPLSIEPEVVSFNIIRDIINVEFARTGRFHEIFENECVLVTRRSLNRYELEMLANANIHHFQLDDGFDAFWRERWLEMPAQETNRRQ